MITYYAWSQSFVHFALSLTHSEISENLWMFKIFIPFALSLTVSEIRANLCFFPKKWKFKKYSLFRFLKKRYFHLFHYISYRFRDKQFLYKNDKIGIFFKFKTHDLEVLSTYYEQAHLLSIGKLMQNLKQLHPVVT